MSKRLKLGSTPIAEVSFFPRTTTLRGVPGQGVGGGSAEGVASGRLDLASTVGGSSDINNSSGGDDGSFSEDVALVFGNEVDGLSGLEEGHKGRSLPAVFLPMRDDVIRSYNLANAVSFCLVFTFPLHIWGRVGT